MKKLLILTDWFAPGYRAGGPIRSVAHLAHTLAGDVEISILTSDRDFQSTTTYTGIKPDRWLPYRENVRVCYLSPARQRLRTLEERIISSGPDIIYLNSMFSPVFTIYPLWLLWRKKVNARVIVAPRGMLHRGAMQYKSGKKKLFLLLLRFSGLIRRLYFHATDQQECLDIMRETGAGANQISVVKNIPTPPTDVIMPIDKNSAPVRLIFFSRISPKKNLLFLLEQLSALPEMHPVELTIAGPVEDQVYWEKCQRAIETLPSTISVERMGALPHHEVVSLMQRHHFFVLPTYGENFGHVIFEALGSGRPVLISDQTPWRGLREKGIGWDVPLDEPGAFRQALAEALALDDEAYQAMCRAAHAFARQFVADCGVRERYLEMFAV